MSSFDLFTKNRKTKKKVTVEKNNHDVKRRVKQRKHMSPFSCDYTIRHGSMVYL